MSARWARPRTPLARLADETPDLIFLDIWMPGMDGLEALAEIKQRRPEAAVVMISGHGTIETAVKATKLGAYDFIEKPLSLEKTLLAVTRALDHSRLERENRALREQLDRGQEIVGKSALIEELRGQIAVAAPTNGRVLIHGENGAGKELVARAIHTLSTRRDGALRGGELRGHPRGADRVRAVRPRARRLHRRGGAASREVRDRPTAARIFLDEIGDMSLKTQAKVLRVLEEQAFERVGGKDTIQVDVRVLAASNQDLKEQIAQGRFREDLYYRLAVIPIEVPPLRRRKEDIPALVEYFIALFSVQNGKRPKTVSVEALAYFLAYDWPGNVRELRNMVERLVIMTPRDVIGPEDLPPPLRPKEPAAGAEEIQREKTLKEARDAFERAYILAELRAHEGNVTRTAEKLGIERSHLYRKLKSYGITPPKT